MISYPIWTMNDLLVQVFSSHRGSALIVPRRGARARHACIGTRHAGTMLPCDISVGIALNKRNIGRIWGNYSERGERLPLFRSDRTRARAVTSGGSRCHLPRICMQGLYEASSIVSTMFVRKVQ